jgi:hypothetical protein
VIHGSVSLFAEEATLSLVGFYEINTLHRATGMRKRIGRRVREKTWEVEIYNLLSKSEHQSRGEKKSFKLAQMQLSTCPLDSAIKLGRLGLKHVSILLGAHRSQPGALQQEHETLCGLSLHIARIQS